MTKIVEAKEVIEISHYIDFKKSILEYVKNGDIHKAVVIYDEFFKSENLFPLSDVSPVESLKTHVAILINSFLELSIESGIPDFIAFSKKQTLIRMLSQKTEEEECIKMGKISIWGFGQQISLAGDKNNSELIKKALFYIHEHLDEKISLQEVADHTSSSFIPKNTTPRRLTQSGARADRSIVSGNKRHRFTVHPPTHSSSSPASDYSDNISCG